ncbi:MAG TPA: helix-turn-helix domain-containing protein, partial [Candidatus Elarobacter sp.]|nr:helix-turn-helix domain-containing protein [Candidatus Elarobacter sp.]
MRIRTPNDLGAVVRERRRQLGLGQAELAARIGVSRQWIVGIESGRSRAELGLVLKTLDTLGMRLEATTAVLASPAGPDIDA